MATTKEVIFDLDAAAFSSDDFRMYQFKVKRCPRARPHDWTQCPFAHPGEKAKRRDPRRYRYSGTACPEFRRNGCCRRGDACPFAHGVFECWLHPSRYRTQMCTDGSSCKRRVCFFAHTDSELRKPEEDPVWLQQQLQAELAAEQQVQQQLQALKLFTSLMGNQGQGSSPVLGQGNNPNLEVLKNLPVASLASLLGGNSPQQQQQQQGQQQQSQQQSQQQQQHQSGSIEEKLRQLTQHVQSGGSLPNSSNLLQLLAMGEQKQGQQAQSGQNQGGHSSASSARGNEMEGAGQDFQLKLAQQYMQAQEQPLQARLAQLQKLQAEQAPAPKSPGNPTMDVLNMLMDYMNPGASSQPLAVHGSLGSHDIGQMALHEQSQQNVTGSAEAMQAMLAARLSSNTSEAQGRSGVTEGGAGYAGRPEHSMMDPAFADMLQQGGLFSVNSAPPNLGSALASTANMGGGSLNLESVLSQLSMVDTRSHRASGVLENLGAAEGGGSSQGSSSQVPRSDLLPEHEQSGLRKEAGAEISGDNKMLMSMWADLASNQNYRAILESLNLLKAGGTVDPANLPKVEDVNAINRSTSFDRILSEIPRNLSDIVGMQEMVAAPSLVVTERP